VSPAVIGIVDTCTPRSERSNRKLLQPGVRIAVFLLGEVSIVVTWQNWQAAGMSVNLDLGGEVMRDLDYTRHYRNWHDGSDDDFNNQVKIITGSLKMLLPEASQRLFLRSLWMGRVAAIKASDIRTLKAWTPIKGRLRLQGERLPVEHVSISQTRKYLIGREGAKDFIFAFDVLEHIQRRASRISRPRFWRFKTRGPVVCRVPNCNSAVATRMRDIDWTHHCSFPKPVLISTV